MESDFQTELPEKHLDEMEWDCCVVGNGVAALWVSHWLWSSKKSVLWITSEEPYSSERAMLQHGWQWGLSQENAQLLASQLTGFEAGAANDPFEMIYYDAKSSKRFKKLTEAKTEWGAHEKDYFNTLARASSEHADLWAWHGRLHRFHDSGNIPGPMKVELFSEPRFVRIQGWPLLELKTTDSRITGAVLSEMSPGKNVEIRAKKFFLGDFDENLAQLIKTPADTEALAGALKGKSYRAGIGLRFWHKELASAPTQMAIIPLVVSPEKDQGSHVVGRFTRREATHPLESLWIGFLTDEELEDNNEILKKIKHAKRAIERALPGFAESITREAVTFEPRMFATDLVKKRKSSALGATLFSDHYGPELVADSVRKIFNGVDGDNELTVHHKTRGPKTNAPTMRA